MPAHLTLEFLPALDWTAYGPAAAEDVSARDLQLPKTQFFESKSYPTFTPVGPRLVLLDAAELARFTDLRLKTWVNGELRQDQTTADMITGPVAALNILTGFQALSPGDLLLTGTPGGPGMRLVDAQHKTMAEFNRAGGAGPHGYPRANMFDQPELEQILLDNLAAHPLVTLRRGAELTSIEGTGPVTIRYTQDGDEHQITADALLGADGANSLVRQAIGSGLRDLRFEERWLVIDVRSPRPLCDWGGVYQICDPARAATFMHVTGDRYRWEFRLADGETADELTTPGQLARLLQPWTPDISDLEIIRKATYTFRARVADRWRRGRVFLLGDAAHQTPPFIGQGLGAGLRDAANLAWKLAAVLHRQAREEILDTYEQERRPHVTRTIRAAVTVGWALTGGQDRAAMLRRAVLAGLCRVPGFSTAVADSASPRLTGSALLDRRLSPRDAIGRLCPQPAITAGPGRDRLDDLLGGGWALLTDGPAAAPAGVRHIDISALGPSGTAQMRRWLRKHRTHAILVRPDRVVAATGRRAFTARIPTAWMDRCPDDRLAVARLRQAR